MAVSSATSSGTSRTVTFAHLISSLSLVGALAAWSMNVSQKALDKAYEAERIALTARPDPYTGAMAIEDWQSHDKTHMNEKNLLREEFLRRLQTLPRPPPEIAADLKDYERRIFALERLLEECINYDSRLDHVEKHCCAEEISHSHD